MRGEWLEAATAQQEEQVQEQEVTSRIVATIDDQTRSRIQRLEARTESIR